MGLEDLAALNIKVVVYWGVTQCNLVDTYFLSRAFRCLSKLSINNHSENNSTVLHYVVSNELHVLPQKGHHQALYKIMETK